MKAENPISPGNAILTLVPKIPKYKKLFKQSSIPGTYICHFHNIHISCFIILRSLNTPDRIKKNIILFV